MRALNPFTGEFYREALQMSRMTREMFCLMEGPARPPLDALPRRRRHRAHRPALHRLPRPADEVRRVHEEGRAAARRPVRLLLRGAARLRGGRPAPRPAGLLGLVQRPGRLRLHLQEHDRVGQGDVRHARASSSTASSSPHDLVEINLGIRILLGTSYYDDWEDGETFVKHDPLGNPVDRRHPWNQTTTPRPQKRDFNGNYTWVMSPRWYDQRTGDHLALDTGGGPIARLWSTALAGLVDIGYIKATGHSVKIYLPKTAMLPEVEFEWKIPKWSNAIERDRARTYFQAYAAAAALYFVEQALKELHAGRTKTWTDFKVPDEAIGCGFHEAVRGVLSHHVVIRDGKIANYHPYPPTPWNANPRDIYGTPGPYEDAVQNTPIFEENGPDKFKGIDIMRAVRSFDPCLPCGVHMYLGNGKLLDVRHTPMFGASRCNVRSDPAPRDAIPAGGTQETHDDEPARRSRVPGAAAAARRAAPEVEAFADPAAQAQTREIVQAVLDLHGAGLERILGHLEAAGEPARDPRRLRPRRRRRRPAPAPRPASPGPGGARAPGPGQVRPALRSHGGDVELLDVSDGVVRLRLKGAATAAPRRR